MKTDMDSGLQNTLKYMVHSKLLNFFKNKYPAISVSTMWAFVKKYDPNVKVANTCGLLLYKKLKNLV